MLFSAFFGPFSLLPLRRYLADASVDLVYRDITEQPGKVSEVLQAFRTFPGSNDMLAPRH